MDKVLSKPFTIRKIAKSGNSKYLSISNIVPDDWIAVKVFTEKLEGDCIIIKLEQIK